MSWPTMLPPGQCKTCGEDLLFSARKEGSGYCGPCLRALQDRRCLVTMPDSPRRHS